MRGAITAHADGPTLGTLEPGDALVMYSDGVTEAESPDGVPFDEAVADGATLDVEGRRVPVIGLSALVKAKERAGRPQDVADVAALRRLRGGE